MFYADNMKLSCISQEDLDINKLIQRKEKYNYLFKEIDVEFNKKYKIHYENINYESPVIKKWCSFRDDSFDVNNYRFYLNNFYNISNNDYVTINTFDYKEEYDKYFNDALSSDNVYTQKDKELLIEIMEKLKSKYYEEKYINIHMYINEEGFCDINVFDYMNNKTNIYRFHKSELNSVDGIYKKVVKSCYRKMVNIKKITEVYKFIEYLNNKYSKIKSGWNFSINSSNEYIGIRKQSGEVKKIGVEILNEYKNKKISIDILKEKLSKDISDYIREQVYGKEILKLCSQKGE
jgi:hypothetical protein